MIGDYIFTGCTIFTNIELPITLTSIGEKTFCKTSIQRITIPEGVTRIGRECLKDVHLSHVLYYQK